MNGGEFIVVTGVRIGIGPSFGNDFFYIFVSGVIS